MDDLLKTDDDNPTIGLLICSDMNKADVQWSFRGISTPMGVATYRTADEMPEPLRKALPDIEELKRQLSNTDFSDEIKSK